MRMERLLIFYLLLACQTTDSLINKHVKLGQNVTLDCPIDVKDIYWVFLKPPDYVLVILRTFSSESTSSLLFHESLKDKYSTLTLSRLFINNVTVDELGLYYCSKTGNTLELSDGIRFDITDPNETELNNQTQQALIVLYVILSIGIFSAVIGLFQINPGRKKRHQQYQDEDLEQLYNTDDEEFTEVEFCLFHRTNNSFAPLQKPKTRLRQI